MVSAESILYKVHKCQNFLSHLQLCLQGRSLSMRNKANAIFVTFKYLNSIKKIALKSTEIISEYNGITLTITNLKSQLIIVINIVFY